MDAWRKWLVMAVAAPACAVAQGTLEEGNCTSPKSTTNGKPDPVQEQDECLRDELKDLAAYFAPALEGVQAKCKKTPRKTRERHHRLQGCTAPARASRWMRRARLKIVGPKEFTPRWLKMDTKTSKERAIVVANAVGRQTGPCKAK
jgi:hypothetical protein